MIFLFNHTDKAEVSCRSCPSRQGPVERVGRKSPSQKQMLNVLKICCNVLTFMSIYVQKKPQWCRDPGRKRERQQLTHRAIEDKMTSKVRHSTTI